MTKYTICIFGAGAIGCYLGACLIAAGQRVIFVGRRKTGNMMARYGLGVSDYRGKQYQIPAQNIAFSEDPSCAADAEFIFITVKSGDSEKVATQLASLPRLDNTIVSFQNGVGNHAIFSRVLPTTAYISGMVPFNVIFSSTGQLHQGTEGELMIAHSSKDERLHNIFAQSPLALAINDDLQAVQWTKLIMNLSNAINALSGLSLVEQLHSRDYRYIMAAVIDEALTVLKHANISTRRIGKVIPQTLPFILRLPNTLFKRVASRMLQIDPLARTSMYEDLCRGRPTEVDYLNGEIVRQAEALGREAPLNKLLQQKVKHAEGQNKGSPGLSAAELLR